MRSVLNPPIGEFFSAEFPCDNPEIWRVRPPPASCDLLGPAPGALAVELSADAEEHAPREAPAVSVVDALAVAEPVEDDTIDVVIDDFTDEDFAHATLESVAPPPMAVVEAAPVAELAPVVEAAPSAEVEAAPSEEESPPVSGEPPAPAPDFFAVYIQTLRDVALTAGARVELVEALPGMLGLERLDVRALDEATVESLVAARLLARGDSGKAVRADALVRTAQAWRSAIAGEEPDFSACGTEMLDEWSATVVSGLVGAPARKEPLRRELRSRGVAAFGLLIEAA